MFILLVILISLLSLFLIGIILLQSGKGGGLAAEFGGASSSGFDHRGTPGGERPDPHDVDRRSGVPASLARARDHVGTTTGPPSPSCGRSSRLRAPRPPRCSTPKANRPPPASGRGAGRGNGSRSCRAGRRGRPELSPGPGGAGIGNGPPPRAARSSSGRRCGGRNGSGAAGRRTPETDRPPAARQPGLEAGRLEPIDRPAESGSADRELFAYSFFGWPAWPRTHRQSTRCRRDSSTRRLHSARFSIGPPFLFQFRAAHPCTQSVMPRTRYWLSEVNTTSHERFRLERPTMPDCRAIRLFVVSCSNSAKSRRCQPRRASNRSIRPAAAPGRARSWNWLPRQDSSA